MGAASASLAETDGALSEKGRLSILIGVKSSHPPADVLWLFVLQIIGILSLRLPSLEIGETQSGVPPPVVLAELVHVRLEEF